MRRVALSCAFVAVAFVSTVAQKIETQISGRMQILRLKTALDHLTVVELGEPVLQVAVGSPAFKVEWRENKVFIQPMDPGAASNLFIWTASQRLNYELEPAGAVADMDFAIDQPPIHSEAILSSTTQGVPTKSTASDFFLGARAVRQPASNLRISKPVEVWIRDVYEQEGESLGPLHGLESWHGGIPHGRAASLQTGWGTLNAISVYIDKLAAR
jgi:hypothetical protein